MDISELYQPLRKYSVTILGHRTSISLEPAFWNVLQEMAEHEQQTMAAFLGAIDKQRISIAPDLNLSSILRLRVLAYLQST